MDFTNIDVKEEAKNDVRHLHIDMQVILNYPPVFGQHVVTYMNGRVGVIKDFGWVNNKPRLTVELPEAIEHPLKVGKYNNIVILRPDYVLPVNQVHDTDQ